MALVNLIMTQLLYALRSPVLQPRTTGQPSFQRQIPKKQKGPRTPLNVCKNEKGLGQEPRRNTRNDLAAQKRRAPL
jgi:hypothetical protein